MATVNITCTGTRAVLSNTPFITSGGTNYDDILVTFSADWDGYEKTAVFFSQGGIAYNQILTDGSCYIPREVLRREGRLFIGIFGVSGDTTISASIVSCSVVAGAITEGTSPTDPTPSVYEQIMAMLDGAQISSAQIDEDGDLIITKSDDTTMNAGHAKGETGDTGAAGLAVTGATINASGELVITLSDGTTINAGTAKGADGLDLTVAQTLTDAQKAQARDNINAAATNGYYSEMGVGTSDNLAGKGDGVGASYIYRTAGGTADVANGRTTIKSIKGNTLVWNQLVQNGNFENTNNWDGNIRGTLTTASNIATYTVTTPYLDATITQNFQSVVGHKYLMSWWIKPTRTAQVGFRFYINNWFSGLIANQWNHLEKIVQPAGQATYFALAMDTQTYAVGETIEHRDIQLFDLTQMFGAGNEPSSVAEFRALFNKQYYAHDTGSLLSFNATGVKTVGFNQWASGQAYALNKSYGSVGQFNNINGDVAFLDYTPVFPSTAYQFVWENNPAGTAVDNGRIVYYDANKNIISVGFINHNSFEFTTPANCTFIRKTFTVGSTATPLTAMPDIDICLHLVWSGIRNGEYEDYWTQTRNLPIATYFPNGMRSAGDVYDELTASKAVTRIGSRAHESGDESDSTVITDGTTTYYALETPTEVDIPTPLNLVYMVSDFGTEEIITADNASTAPCNMSVVYGMNAVDFIRNAPKNYISAESFDGFAAALGAALNVTITKTWDDTNGKYTFTVVAN